MEKIRKGKDVFITWAVETGGQPLSLAGRDLRLELRGESGHCLLLPITVNGNVLTAVFLGRDQHYMGVYHLTLWENYGQVGQNVLDACRTLELVPHTCMESHSGSQSPNISFGTVSLSGDLAAGAITASISAPYRDMKRIAPYLFECDYDKIDYEYADRYFQSKAVSIMAGGCSSIRMGNFYLRLFDWLYNQNAEFVVRTPSVAGRHAVMGVCGGIDALTDAVADAREYSDAWNILPFYMQDGINQHGVFANINVVPTDIEVADFTTPVVSQEKRLCTLMLVRFVLDHFSTATEAVQYLRNHVSVYSPDTLKEMGYGSHFMIGDPTVTYVVELIGDEVVYFEHHIMTNFNLHGVTFGEDMAVYEPQYMPDGHHATEQGVTPYGSGLERYNEMWNNDRGHYCTLSDVRVLWPYLKFSNAYDANHEPFFYTDFVSREHGITVDTPAGDPAYQPVLQQAQQAWEERDRNDPKVWHSCHVSIYDLQKRKLYLVSQEDAEHEYPFNFRRYYTAAEIDEMFSSAN